MGPVAVFGVVCIAMGAQASSAAQSGAKGGASAPNIVYFLVDDLGYANIGVNNDEPLTPNIDKLHTTGIQLMEMHAFRFCSPTRSAIMSGRLPVHVNQQNHPPEYPGGGVPLGMTTIADKLSSVGYSCHMLGKWHCGMSGPDRLPINRGFNTSFGYLSGAEDHYAMTRDGYVDFWRNDKPAYGENGTEYSNFLYTKDMLNIIDNHNGADPLFLYMAFQNVHGPLQVPTNFTDLYNQSIYKPRLMCLGMIAAVDESIGAAVSKLYEKNFYENTLIIFTSDNGGPADHANNWPFRGSKGDDFEGGTRVCSCISGGYISSHLRGTKRSGLMHVADWYATLGSIAGYTPNDPKADAAGLPSVDSLDMWPLMSGQATVSPRTELCLSIMGNAGAIIKKVNGTNFKLLRGPQGSSAGTFPGPHMPNSSGLPPPVDCGVSGWLFDLDSDPIEHHELSQIADYATVLKTLQDALDACNASVFQSDGSDNIDPASRQAAIARGGYWGPWLPPGPVPSPTPPPPPAPSPPPAGSFKLKLGDQCLTLDGSTHLSHVIAGACDTYSDWTVDKDSTLVNACSLDQPEYKYPRHTPPSKSCAIGTEIILGEETPDVKTTFSAGYLKASDCNNMCISISNSTRNTSGPVVLAVCGDSGTVWTKQ